MNDGIREQYTLYATEKGQSGQTDIKFHVLLLYQASIFTAEKHFSSSIHVWRPKLQRKGWFTWLEPPAWICTANYSQNVTYSKI